jgi:hypothetical protein
LRIFRSSFRKEQSSRKLAFLLLPLCLTLNQLFLI